MSNANVGVPTKRDAGNVQRGLDAEAGGDAEVIEEQRARAVGDVDEGRRTVAELEGEVRDADADDAAEAGGGELRTAKFAPIDWPATLSVPLPLTSTTAAGCVVSIERLNVPPKLTSGIVVERLALLTVAVMPVG
jgi:hypothetical protein